MHQHTQLILILDHFLQLGFGHRTLSDEAPAQSPHDILLDSIAFAFAFIQEQNVNESPHLPVTSPPINEEA
jgi:hypothetical protein